ncbi:hypothetical protein QBC37DRAFT_420879 [Rhypophila decipiens]|uniref:Transmembrane protein n=1 Tax=Rhypophila decipiens TaxID=261697 RepID=A0AAN6Y9U3_9PEZI|nr:hypothetical protein QBC37DRAFT_420879 [Rhypophila decipiens]
MAPRPIPNHIHLHVHILPRNTNPIMNSPQPHFNPVNAPIPIPPPLAAPFPPGNAHAHSPSNYTQPRTPPIPTSGSDPASTTSTSDPSETSQTTSLWSSTYSSGAGVKLAAAMDLGLLFCLAVFLGVVIIQWKRRTGAVSLPVALQVPKDNGDNTTNGTEKGHLQVTSSVEPNTMTITPPRPARSRIGSESKDEHGQKKDIQPSMHEAYFSTSTADHETQKANNTWAWSTQGEEQGDKKRFGRHGGAV